MSPEEIEDLFASFGPVKVRRLFGGRSIYADGVMFALEADGELYLKADAGFAEELAARGSRPFTFHRKGRGTITLSYWLLPEGALDDGEDLAQLSARALGVARQTATLPSRIPRTGKTPRNRPSRPRG